MERPQQQFRSPEEEIAFLRAQIAEREREILSRTTEVDRSDVEVVGKQELKEYVSFTPKMVLDKGYHKSIDEYVASAAQVEGAFDRVEETLQIAFDRGIHHALSVIEDRNDAYLADEVHRRLIEYIHQGRKVQGLREGVPPWRILHMTLFEVTLPDAQGEAGGNLSELLARMQQFIAGMRSVHTTKDHYVLEMAVAEGSDDIVLYVAVPNVHIDLFEKIILSLFPGAMITEQAHDYNIFVDQGATVVAEASQSKHPIYPFRHGDEFQSDPLYVLLNAFSKIETSGCGAAVQLVVKPVPNKHLPTYHQIMKRVEEGMKVKDSIAKSTLGGEMMFVMKEMLTSAGKESKDDPKTLSVDTEALERFRRKIEFLVVEVNLRIAVSASEMTRAEAISGEIEAAFNQFQSVGGNELLFTRLKGSSLRKAIKAFSFREFNEKTAVHVSENELATLFHFPTSDPSAAPQYKQSHAKTAAAPTAMPTEGTLLGINEHRGVQKHIYVTEKDRMRHFYIIGQTGTGKSVFMKNLIVQDIEQGAGVCMIDPHGTDIEDVLAAVPPERADDVVYFDPSNLEHVIGLNMLEYDYDKPEQKTFVVNELFSIFQKLYGANPESMGPMFEQYFRNATLLVMEDPESGNTLMDISRVMADAAYRRYKLSKATNPVVKQFWSEIATKAGGEASLENIVPYIVSKFDVFTANDYMRPIIGQQRSAFNFRELMDTRKILLVNLSKGRLGEINSNLIGMIMVGKILMAALSRVDRPSMDFPPFFLHIDEFQNVSTPSISAILSEARKYKLGLTVAHQFIAQLDERIRDAVFGNVGSMAVFRTGPEDAQFLEKQLEPVFTANDIMNIPNWKAYVRVLANGVPSKPFSISAMQPSDVDQGRVQAMVERSQARYARPRAEIEAEIQRRYQKPKPPLPGLQAPAKPGLPGV